MAEFRPAFELAIAHEGGFTDNPNDRGNWTSGKIGVGKLNGTKWGLSAMTYPDLHIFSLTRENAYEIYLRDWWAPKPYRALISQEIANRVFDFAINIGDSEAAQLLQIAVSAAGHRLAIDGALGPKSLAAVNAADARIVLIALRAAAAARYDTLADMDKGFRWAREGWLNRALGPLRA